MSDHSSTTPSRPATPVPALHSAPRPAYRFTWDPPATRPGPESVSGTTEGRGDYFAAQPSLGLLNTSSAALALGTLPTEWSSSKHGFHAISTVLNNPHKRQAPPKAHSALPAVPPADLPRVRRKDFDSYLRAITPDWDRFERNTQLGRDGAAQLDDPASTPRASLASDTFPSTSSAPPRTFLPVQGRNISPLDSVPAVFFDPAFNLGDPRTFNIVTEQNTPSSPTHHDEWNDPSSLSHSLPLLEKFSHYADTVEQHLIREISLRSTSFFAALTNLNDLQSESEECLVRIGKLRALLKDVDENNAKCGLEVVRHESRLRNVSKVQEGVRWVAGVVEVTGVARGLVAAGQWGEGLGVIEDMERLWYANPGASSAPDSATPPSPPPKSNVKPPHHHGNGRLSPLPPMAEEDQQQHGDSPKKPVLLPLSSLHAFSALPSHLRALTTEITTSLSSELVSVLRADLAARIDSGRHNSTSLRDRLKPLLQGLIRTKGVREATLTWREVVVGDMRVVVEARLPAIDTDGDIAINAKEQRPGLANHLRNMSHTEFMGVIQDTYRRLLNAVEGLQTQGDLIVEVLESIAPSPPFPLQTLQEELSDILHTAAELANTQAAHTIVAHRAEQHAALSLPEFLAFFSASWGFVLACEVVCRKMIVALRGVVVGQAKTFLQTFHQARISQSAKLVEDEQWNPTEVPAALQHIAGVLVDSAVRDSPELVVTIQDDNAGANSSRNEGRDSLAMKKANGSVAGAASKHLRIEDRTYFAVSATAEVLVLLLDYLRVIVNLPLLTTDTMSRVIEFLKAFNSRTCQVVLGAGAMRSAGLKNITAKHLALASQSLSIMFELIPYVRETFRRHLSLKQAVMLVEFDKLKRDYQEHQNEIHAKLIAIMGDRLSAHIKTLQGVDWNVPKPGGGVNDYMEILVKETVTLHKVLSRYLSTPVVEYVMTQVFAAINHRLSEEYGHIELPHQEAKTRLLADAKFLHQKLAALKNVGTPSAMLETVITEKSIPRKNVPTPTRSNTFSSASANQRLKGLLSGRTSSLLAEKTPPAPTETPFPPLSSIPLPTPLAPRPADAANGSVNGSSSSSSTASLSQTPPRQAANQGLQPPEPLPPASEPGQAVVKPAGAQASTPPPPSVSPPPPDYPAALELEDLPTRASIPALDTPAASLEDANMGHELVDPDGKGSTPTNLSLDVQPSPPPP